MEGHGCKRATSQETLKQCFQLHIPGLWRGRRVTKPKACFFNRVVTQAPLKVVVTQHVESDVCAEHGGGECSLLLKVVWRGREKIGAKYGLG